MCAAKPNNPAYVMVTQQQMQKVVQGRMKCDVSQVYIARV